MRPHISRGPLRGSVAGGRSWARATARARGWWGECRREREREREREYERVIHGNCCRGAAARRRVPSGAGAGGFSDKIGSCILTFSPSSPMIKGVFTWAYHLREGGAGGEGGGVAFKRVTPKYGVDQTLCVCSARVCQVYVYACLCEMRCARCRTV